tara:strand:+ start:203 stop:1063 length:861 start_codon:yes stop_codon:yes gene_type:complete
MIKPKILCTGAPRSGTSLFNLLMSYFQDLKVNTEGGTPQTLFYEWDVFTSQQRPDGKIWNDYIGNTPLSFVDILKRGIKLIVIYRDGRDCFISARQTRSEDVQGKYDKMKSEKGPLFTYESSKTETSYWYSIKETEKWLNSVKETFQTLEVVKGTKLEQNYLIIRYEDLVHNPETEMKRVKDFVGLPLDPDYIKFYDKANYRRMVSSPSIMGKNSQAINEDSAYEGAIGSDHNDHRPIAPDSIGRWKKPIHKERIKEILSVYENEITDMLIELKYETNKKWIDEIK